LAEVSIDGLTLHVQRLGEGPCCAVFLHGLVMDNLSSWYFSVATKVARESEVLLYDLRGHGLSGKPEAGYRLRDQVADLDALLGKLLPKRQVVLVGNSFGGLLALAYAAKHPGRVQGLALVDALAPDAGWGEAMAKTLSIEGDARNRLIADSFASWLGRNSKRKRNRLAKVARRLVEETSLLPDLRRSEALRTVELKAIECPALLVYGTESDQREVGERLARVLPGSRLLLLPGCTHSVLWEATERVRDEIVRFVTGLAPSCAGESSS